MADRLIFFGTNAAQNREKTQLGTARLRFAGRRAKSVANSSG
jgi:hypothetical protein